MKWLLTLWWCISLNCSVFATPTEDFRPVSLCTQGVNTWVCGQGGLLQRIDDQGKKLQTNLGHSLGKIRLYKGEIYLLTREAQGQLLIVNPESLKTERKVSLGHYPWDFRIEKDIAYICHRFADKIQAIDLKTGKQLWQQKVRREPIALCVVGQKIWIATHLAHQSANAKQVGCRLVCLNSTSGKIEKIIDLPDGSTGLRDLQTSADGKRLYCSFVLGRHRVPATQIARGWINTNALGILDLETKQLTTVLLDEIDRGAPNPWGIAIRAGQVAVALSGSNEFLVIDEKKLLTKIFAVKPDQRAELAQRLAFVYDCSKRIRTNVRGLRKIFASEQGWSVLGYYGNSLQACALDGTKVKSVQLSEATTSEFRLGEELFHDARISFQAWQSCASCHPDGRADALNWDRPYDGLGNSRNTKSLLLAHKTAPSAITAYHVDAHAASAAALKFMASSAGKKELDSLMTYIASIKPIPSPALTDLGKLTEAAKRGKIVFEQASCSDCHRGQQLTSRKMRDVGTGLGKEKGKKFDVPSLKEIWRTAPYLHDGRAATLEEILIKYKTKDHGELEGITKKQVKDLQQYLLSL